MTQSEVSMEAQTKYGIIIIIYLFPITIISFNTITILCPLSNLKSTLCLITTDIDHSQSLQISPNPLMPTTMKANSDH